MDCAESTSTKQMRALFGMVLYSSNFALFWTFLNIERCERDCSSFPERTYTQDNRRHLSSDFFSEEKDVIGGIIKVYRRP